MLTAHRALILMALVIPGCGPAPSADPPMATDGVMDLSQWDFETQGTVALRGRWMFRYGELLGPSALRPGDAPTPPMILVPGAWSDVSVNGVRRSSEGFATHALRLTLPDRADDLAIAFGETHSADRVWIDGRLVMERGRVSSSREGELQEVQGRIVTLDGLGGAHTLVVEISNHFQLEGGPLHTPRLGTRSQLRERAEADAHIDFFLIGCLMVIGLFYAALSLTRSDREIVLFAIMALLMALRTAIIKWHVTALLPMGPEVQLRLDYITLIALLPLFCALIEALFPADVPRLILRVAFWYAILALIGPLALDTLTFSSARNFNIVMSLVLAAVSLLFVGKAAFLGRPGARPVLISCLFALGVASHDLASVLRLIPEARELLPIGNTVLAFAHAVVLGRRLSDALSASERLTSSLRDSNALLEERIAARTRDLERLAMTDPLTGLLNRRPLLKLAEAERARAVRSKEAIGLMMIDCDGFKLVNDRHGHEAGDQVLCALSQRFLDLVRSHDLIGRWGGEEFVMIFSTTDALGAEAAAERVRRHVADQPFEVRGGRSLRLTVSIGVALLDDPLESFEDLLRRADQALYAAKAEGKNRVSMAPGEAPDPTQ